MPLGKSPSFSNRVASSYTQDMPTDSAPAAPPEEAALTSPARRQECLLCGEPVDEMGAVRTDYCFQCAVHVICSCAD
jgi:hypothetical protein